MKESGAIGATGKKDDTVTKVDGAMEVDESDKKDGAAAVTDSGQDAAAHSPAAEGVPKPVQTELPPNVKDDTED